MLADGIARLADLQQRLYAQDRWAVLVVLQGMDAAGKDSVIKHVMSGVNPQGCEVHGFKVPSEEELQHDFFWRVRIAPAGARSHRHFQSFLLRRSSGGARASEPAGAREAAVARRPARTLEAAASRKSARSSNTSSRNGTIVLKFHLRISKEEQRKRFLARLDEPGKRWKFSTADITERERWDEYMEAFEDMIRSTSTPRSAVVRCSRRSQARRLAGGFRRDHRGVGSTQGRFPESSRQGARAH